MENRERHGHCYGAPLAMAFAMLWPSIANAQAVTEADPAAEQEIVVTASGRASRVADIPYNISAVSGKDLAVAGVSDIADLSRQVVGMSFANLGARSNGIANSIILRGLNGSSVGGQNASLPSENDPMVSVYVNAIPLFSNFKINDVERVEVLRGPQGTLYGAGSIGGTVRFILNKPDTKAFTLDVESKIAAVNSAGKPNYGFDATVNIPLTDRFAVRINGGYEDIPGVINAVGLIALDSNGIPRLANPADYFGSAPVFTQRKNVDDADIAYVRASALWNITDNWDGLLTIQHQETDASDFTGQFPNGPARQHRRFRTSPAETDVTLYALELTGDLGFATFTSSTGYSETKVNSAFDDTNYGIEARDFYAGFPRISSYADVNFKDRNIVEEVRLISKSGGSWDWVIGAFYSNFKRRLDGAQTAPGWSEYANAPNHPLAVQELGAGASWADYQRLFYPDATFDTDVTYALRKRDDTRNIALYGELTHHFGPRFSLTGGARVFWTKNSRSGGQRFFPVGSAGDVDASSTQKVSDSLFKVNAAYDITDNIKAYATWSQGFRQGGANALPLSGPYAEDPSLTSFRPDFADNYEIGIKGSLGRGSSFSAALYRIIWNDIQIQITSPNAGVAAIVNGGKARAQGLELESQLALGANLDLKLGYTYTDAKLVEDAILSPGIRAFDGDRLPGTPKHTATMGLTYNQPTKLLGGNLTYHVDGSYRSSVFTELNAERGNYVKLSGFTTWNASISWSNERFRASLFMDNITDEAGVSAAYIDEQLNQPPGDMYFIQRPRTFGLSIGYHY